MRREVFNNVFDTYRQQALLAIEEETARRGTTPESSWLERLRQHVQEWKQHYSQQDQAMQQIKAKYYFAGRDKGSLTELEQRALVSEEEREYQATMASFQVKRETIWQRQQEELSNDRISL